MAIGMASSLGPELQQNSGQNHRTRRRRLYVRIWQPCVERPQGYLDRESKPEETEQPDLLTSGNCVVEQLEPIGGKHSTVHHVSGLESDIQNAHEHEQRARECEQHELDGRIDAILSSPDADDEIHRNQRELEKDVEEQHIE
jgi:hypothetical protein